MVLLSLAVLLPLIPGGGSALTNCWVNNGLGVSFNMKRESDLQLI